MPTFTPTDIDAAYALEARTWLALEGHIPGHPKHDATAWSAWRVALHAALKAAAEPIEVSSCMHSYETTATP